MSIRRTFSLFALSFFVLGIMCAEDPQSSDEAKSVSVIVVTDDRSTVEKGMDVIFTMTNGFLDIVQPNNLLEQQWFKDVISITINGTWDNFSLKWQDGLGYGKGYVACIAVGLLFLFIMPIFGLCFCCCRCCGKCGGRPDVMDPPKAKCKRTTYCGILLVLNTIMLAGVVCAFVANDLIHSRLQNTDNNGPVGKVSSSLTTLQDYLNSTVKEVSDDSLKKFDEIRDDVIQKINGSANIAVQKFADSLNATSLLNQAEDIAQDANKTKTELETLASTLQNLANMGEKLSHELTTIKTSIQADCNRTNVTGVDVSDYETDADFTQLSNLSSVATNVSSTLDMKQFVDQAKQKIEEVKHNATEIINDKITEANSKLDDIRTKVKDKLDNFKDQIKNIRYFEDAQKQLNATSPKIAKYGDYIFYGGIGVCCIYLLIVVLYYLGVLYGMCGERPGRGAPCCNKGNGGNFLVAGVGFSFFFSWLLMLIIMILFLVGGVLYTEGCRYFVKHEPNDLEPINDFVKQWINIPKTIFKNSEVDLDLVTMLNDCKNDTPVYKALKLQYIINISALVDTSSLDKELDKIGNSSVTFNNIKLLSPELRDSINNFADSGLSSINFTEYDTQLSKKLVKVDLYELAEALRNESEKINTTYPELAKNLTGYADQLKKLKDTYVNNMTADVKTLNNSLNTLKTQMDIKNKTQKLLDALDATEKKFNSEGTTKVTEELKSVALELKNTTNKEIHDFIYKIENNYGKCRPVFDAFYLMTDSVCVTSLQPLNAFWFGMGWCIFFFIPSIIFAVLLTGLYRREEEYEPSKDLEDPNYPTYAGHQHPDTIPLTSVNQHNGPDPGYSNSGYHRDDQPRSRSSGYNNNGYSAYGGNPHSDYPGSKQSLPPSYGGGTQVYPYGKPPRCSY